jgi:NAD(P)H-dependent FMN reductase
MKIVILKCSTSQKSRSSILANFVTDLLSQHSEIELETIDLLDYPDLSFSMDTTNLENVFETFRHSDACVIATPIHNWNVSSVTQTFLSLAIDHEDMKKNKPYLILGGAGSSRSHLAFDGLIRTLQYETEALIVGRPIYASNEEVDRDQHTIILSLQDKLKEKTDAFIEICKAVHKINYKA